MRTLVVLALACLALPAAGIARPLDVHVRVHHADGAGRILLSEGILTPHQLACTYVVRGKLGSARVAQVSLFQRHGGACPGAPQPPTYLFDLYVDTVSGVVDYTPEAHDELLTVLPGEHIIE
jgi:hypothetical protein